MRVTEIFPSHPIENEKVHAPKCSTILSYLQISCRDLRSAGPRGSKGVFHVGFDYCSVPLKKMKILKLKIGELLVRRRYCQNPCTEHCGVQRVAKEWASPRESQPSELVSSASPPKEPHHNSSNAKINDWSTFTAVYFKSSQHFSCSLRPKRGM